MIKKNKIYLSCLLTTIFLLSAFVFILNIIVDPLWYNSGNRIAKTNYPFNERLSKTNQFINKKDECDCLIFGSSRATLLNENNIDKYKCFNYSFSGGRINEFVKFSSYVEKIKSNFSLIIVGVDDFNLFEKNDDSNVPEYIINKGKPPTLIKSYLTIDAAVFSLKTLLKISPMDRYYDEKLICKIMPGLPPYKPDRVKLNHEITNISYNEYGDVLDDDCKINFDSYLKIIEKYKLIKMNFSKAMLLGYVPPISPWEIASWSKKRYVIYLNTIFSISRFISPFYDFSIPSSITANPSNTYDGSHYNAKTNILIAERLNQQSEDFGARVDTLSKAQYFLKYQKELQNFLKTQEEKL